MSVLMLLAYILWQMYRLNVPAAPMNLLTRLVILGVAFSLFRLIGNIMAP